MIMIIVVSTIIITIILTIILTTITTTVININQRPRRARTTGTQRTLRTNVWPVLALVLESRPAQRPRKTREG